MSFVCHIFCNLLLLPTQNLSAGTSTLVMLNKICSLTAKTRAIPSLPAGRQACTVIVYWLKNQDSARCLRSDATVRTGRVTPQPCRLAPSLKQPTGLFLYARPYCRAVISKLEPTNKGETYCQLNQNCINLV